MQNLTPKQLKAVTSLLEGATVANTAKAVGVSERQVYRWLDSEDFKKALDNGIASAYNQALEKAVLGAGEAIQFLRDVIADQDASNRDRLTACKELLSNADKWKDRQMEERIARLETLLELKDD
jgi:AcrR family transcriptional regulator